MFFTPNMNMMNMNMNMNMVATRSKNILIGSTGSVAAIKLPHIISELKSKDPTINVSKNKN